MAQPRDHGRTRAASTPAKPRRTRRPTKQISDAEVAAMAAMTFEPYPESILTAWSDQDRFGMDLGLRLLCKSKSELVSAYRGGGPGIQKTMVTLIHETGVKLKAAAGLMECAEARLIAATAVAATGGA